MSVADDIGQAVIGQELHIVSEEFFLRVAEYIGDGGTHIGEVSIGVVGIKKVIVLNTFNQTPVVSLAFGNGFVFSFALANITDDA